MNFFLIYYAMHVKVMKLTPVMRTVCILSCMKYSKKIPPNRDKTLGHMIMHIR